jgi:hypothetical protein
VKAKQSDLPGRKIKTKQMEDKKMRTLKSWNKKAMLTVTCATLATVLFLTIGGVSAFAGGFLATGKTVAENEAVWGNPSMILKFNDGTEKRYYKYQNSVDVGYRTFVYRDNRAVDDGSIDRYLPEPPKAQPAYQVVTK